MDTSYKIIPLYGFDKTFYNGESHLTKFIKFLKEHKVVLNFEKGPWLCGGAVRRFLSNVKEEGDYDLFFHNEASFNAVAEVFKDHITNQNKFNTAIEISGYKIQLVKFPAPSNAHIFTVLDAFDFTLCMVGTDGENIYYYSVDDKDAFEHILSKRIVVHKIGYGNSSMRRIFKYIKQGYYMCDGAISTFLNAIGNDPTVINEDIKYID